MINKKAKTYEDILRLKEELENNPDWEEANSLDTFDCYGGGSMNDIDYEFVYYNASTGKGVQIVINYEYKHATMRRLSREELEQYHFGGRK